MKNEESNRNNNNNYYFLSNCILNDSQNLRLTTLSE